MRAASWIPSVALLALAGACGGCSKSDDARRTAAGGGAGGAAETIAVLDAWRGAKLSPSEFAAADASKLGATACQAGTVDGLETTLCEYPDDAAARAAEPAGMTRVGEATGTAIAHGRLLLVIADRKKVDPEGRRLNLIARTFRGK